MSEIAMDAVEYLDRLRMDPGSTDPPASIPILLPQRRSVGCFTYPSAVTIAKADASPWLGHTRRSRAHILTASATTIHAKGNATGSSRFPDCSVIPGDPSTERCDQFPCGSHDGLRETTPLAAARPMCRASSAAYWGNAIATTCFPSVSCDLLISGNYQVATRKSRQIADYVGFEANALHLAQRGEIFLGRRVAYRFASNTPLPRRLQALVMPLFRIALDRTYTIRNEAINGASVCEVPQKMIS